MGTSLLLPSTVWGATSQRGLSVAPKNHASCRRGGAVGWYMVRGVARPSAQTQREGDQQTAKHDRVGPNPEDQGQGARSREGEQEQTKHDREHAAEAEEPFAADQLSQPNGRDHLGNAGYHGPSGDKEEQGEGSDARPEESQNADDDARHAFEDEPTPALTLPRADRHDEIEHAIGERPSSKEYHQSEETQARRNKRQDTKQNGGNTSCCEGPPTASEGDDHGRCPLRKGRWPTQRDDRRRIEVVRAK